MFYGEFRHTVDEKSRLSIPSRFRTLLVGDGNDKFFLTRGLDKHLLLCTTTKWQELEAKFTKHSLTNSAARNLKGPFIPEPGKPPLTSREESPFRLLYSNMRR
jgi:division/cell wall cluster transcriptional repressor MraZ